VLGSRIEALYLHLLEIAQINTALYQLFLCHDDAARLDAFQRERLCGDGTGILCTCITKMFGMNPVRAKLKKNCLHLHSTDLQGLAGDDIDGIHSVNARFVHVDLQIFAAECFPINELYKYALSHCKSFQIAAKYHHCALPRAI